jgi:hypothetical protein
MFGSNMNSLTKSRPGREFKIFDPRDPSTASGGSELLDASVAKRNEQWWMYLAGRAAGHGATDIYSASLHPEAPLSAAGWKPTRDATGELVPVAERSRSFGWDGNGGRHCPAYVKRERAQIRFKLHMKIQLRPRLIRRALWLRLSHDGWAAES